MAKGDDIQKRLIDFAVSIIQLTAKLPKSSAGKHIASQLLRSGTSPAPNYAEARSAESPNDFIHKLKIVLKELNETTVWLEIITQSQMIPIEEFIGLKKECGELCRIMSASVKTAQRHRKNNQ
jgi:four helix bundle protein